MANKYANLIGTNLIKDEYTKINTGFDGVDADMKAVESAIENHETAADPHDQYALDTDLATLESALEGHELDDTAHGIGAIAQAVDNLEQEVSSHEAEIVSQVGGVHGLEIEEGDWTPFLEGTTTAGNNNYSSQNGKYYKIGKRVMLRFNITLTSKDSAMSGGARIGGIPFNISPTSSIFYAGIISNLRGWTAPNNSTVMFFGGTTSNKIDLHRNNIIAGASEFVVVSELSNGFRISGVVEYIIS